MNLVPLNGCERLLADIKKMNLSLQGGCFCVLVQGHMPFTLIYRCLNPIYIPHEQVQNLHQKMNPIVELAVANSELSTKNSGRTLIIAPKSAGSREPCRIWSWENIPKRSVPDLSYTNRTISPVRLVFVNGYNKPEIV